MTATWSIVAALAVGAPSFLGVSAPATAADYVDRASLVPLSRSVLRVEAVADGRLRVGTGITAAPGVVVTNCHVVLGATSVRVLKRGGFWRAEGLYVDAEHDLCYLRTPTWPGQPMTIAEPESVRLNQRVAALGYTGGADLSISDGTVLDLHRHDAARIIRTDAGFNSGASGGALVDERGRLLGILTFRLPGRNDRFYALPSDWVRRVLERDPAYEPIPTVAVASPIRAFWQRGAADLPYFMRAEALELERRWADLADLADRWQGAEPQNAEPWIAKGRAMREMDRPDAAARALRRALNLAADRSDAWFELGRTSVRLGDGRSAAEALERLGELDSVLARRLDDLMQPKPDPSR
jgi:serine protease Do